MSSELPERLRLRFIGGPLFSFFAIDWTAFFLLPLGAGGSIELSVESLSSPEVSELILQAELQSSDTLVFCSLLPFFLDLRSLTSKPYHFDILLISALVIGPNNKASRLIIMHN
jgi:hypothetical protein